MQRTQQHTTEPWQHVMGTRVAMQQTQGGQGGRRQPAAHAEYQGPRQQVLMWPTSRDGDSLDGSSPSRLLDHFGASLSRAFEFCMCCQR